MQGLPECMIAHTSRELLPHVFNLTPPSPQVEREGQLFSVALSVSHRSGNPAVHRCIALRCPDFPTQLEAESIAWPAAKIQDVKERSQKYHRLLTYRL